MKVATLILADLVLLIGVGQARASTVLYSNGAINGGIDGLTITPSFSVTDSFTVSTTADLISALIGVWERPSNVPVQLQWSIGTSAFGAQVSSGTSTLTNTFFGTNDVNGTFDVYSSTFAISGAVAPGTQYWLTLQNLVDSSGGAGYWDQNNGPSLAEYNGGTGFQSESFTIYGAAVPEPSSFILLGIAFALMCCRWRLKRKRMLAVMSE